MIIKIAAFSHKGSMLARCMGERLKIAKTSIAFFNKTDFNGHELKSWVEESFNSSDALIFVGACQIAVRLIAPFLKSKITDPAVVVIDDGANFCIPILSGHIGGANEFADRLSQLFCLKAIITTSTDVNNVFAIDNWAKSNGLIIKNPEVIKKISSKIIENKSVFIYSDYPFLGELPPNVIFKKCDDYDVIITNKCNVKPNCLHLIPPNSVVGCGCKKNISYEKFNKYFFLFLKNNNISLKSISAVASIDLKKDEEAICKLSETLKIPFLTFSAKELNRVSGEFSSSPFVLKSVGVDNVCERSAVLASKGSLLIKKTIYDGITFALSVSEINLKF